MKKLMSIFLSLLCFISFSITIKADTKLSFGGDEPIFLVRIVEVIDGEIFKVVVVKDTYEGKEMLVHLIGIDTEGAQETYTYSYDRLLGELAFLKNDPNEKYFPDLGPFIDGYLYTNLEKPFNIELVEKGLAKVNHHYSKAEQYQDLMKAENYAKNQSIGTWSNGSASEHKVKININTAPYLTLTTMLEDTTGSMASNIILYRQHNPFNSVEEIKFADENIDAKWFEKNRSKLTIITDLQTASPEELATLFPNNYNDDALNRLIEYTLFNEIKDKNDIEKVTGLGSHYDYFKNYIATDYTDAIVMPSDYKTVNINTASIGEIKTAGSLTETTAKKIIEARDKEHYYFKNISELAYLNIGLTSRDLLYKKDNFSAITNLNTATKDELLSLFGNTSVSDWAKEYYVKKIINNRPYTNKTQIKDLMLNKYYNYMAPFIYATDDAPVIYDVYNINLVNKDDLINKFNLSQSEAYVFKHYYSRFENTSYLKFNYQPFANDFCFYTNINTVSADGLYLMDENMTSKIVDAIIQFRTYEPFTSLTEVEEVFRANQKTCIYNKIKDFIVFY